MFDDHDRVAAITEAKNRVRQTFHVGRVQTRGRLVQYVQHVDQAAAQCGGQRDTLRFATGKCSQRSIELQVTESDILQVTDAISDLRQRFRCDF